MDDFNLSGVRITEGNVGNSILPEDTSASILVFSCPDISVFEMPIDESGDSIHVIIRDVQDAELKGITKDHATGYGQLLHRCISEFFRFSPKGSKLYLSLQDAKTINGMAADYTFQNAILFADGKARQLAIVCWYPNPEEDYLNGFDPDVYTAIELLNDIGVWAFENNMPLSILLEGRNMSPSTTEWVDLRSNNLPEYPYVSVCVGRDADFAKLIEDDFSYSGFADMGTFLGVLSASEINQNIAEVEIFNLTKANNWKTPSLSIAGVAESVSAEDLDRYGYIFGIKYVGLEGVRFNNDHVCAPIVIDEDGNMNVHSIALMRTRNEAVRQLRTVLLPKVKTRQPVDPKTGKLPVGVVKYFDSLGDGVFNLMQSRLHISAGKTYTDPNSDLLIEKQLKVRFKIVPYGSIGEIVADINLNKTID